MNTEIAETIETTSDVPTGPHDIMRWLAAVASTDDNPNVKVIANAAFGQYMAMYHAMQEIERALNNALPHVRRYGLGYEALKEIGDAMRRAKGAS